MTVARGRHLTISSHITVSIQLCGVRQAHVLDKHTVVNQKAIVSREGATPGIFFGEISALTQVNRSGRPLRELLASPELHPRLVNGSDYPLPAINLIYQTRQLLGHGLIAPEEREPLNELYDVNPLLFDLVTKRTLRHPENGGSLPPSIFMLPEGWEIVWPPEDGDSR